MNYLGDWGTQVSLLFRVFSPDGTLNANYQFGMLALGYHRFGSNEALSQDPIKHLYDIYVLINAASESDPSVKEEAAQYFKRLENGKTSCISSGMLQPSTGFRRRSGAFALAQVEGSVYRCVFCSVFVPKHPFR
jgi:arginyl-tRNA synthetase